MFFHCIITWYYVNKSDNIKLENHAFSDDFAVSLSSYCLSNASGLI